MTTKIYAIRRKSDGMFSTGGLQPKFTKNGKMWNIGHLKTHLRLHQSSNFSIYEGCELVVFEETTSDITFDDIVDPMQQDELVKRLKRKY